MSNDKLNDEMTLDELEQVTGGAPKMLKASEAQLTRLACRNCGEICMVDLRRSSYICPACRMKNIISG